MNAQKTDKQRQAGWALAGALAGLVLLALVFLTMGVGAPSAACAEGPIVRYVAPTGADNGDCINPNSPCRTIQYAIDQAGSGDEIRIAAGIYTDLHARPAPAGYPRPPASGVITQVAYVSRTVTLRGGYTTANWTTPNPAANPTTLDAGGGGRGLVVAGTISPTVEGLRFTGGNAAGLGGAGSAFWWVGLPDAGGGIYVTSATLTLSGCQLYGNTASYGGGLHLRMSENTILSGNTFISNTAVDGDGGGLHLHASTNVTITGNTIISNTAASDGGLSVLQSRTVTLSGNHIVSNTASQWDSGGLGVSQSYTVTLIGNTISGNVASGDGGGLQMSQSYTITLTDNTISGNTAARGGGLYMIQCYNIALTGNHIVSNTASRWDGGGLEVSPGDPVSLTSNTISGNTAADDGGGIYLGSDATLNGDLISGNTAADDGGGIYLGSDATLNGNLISGNTVITGDGGGIYLDGDYTTLNGNTITGNLAGRWGGGLALDSDYIALTGNTIASNTASYGGGLWVHGSQGTALDNNVIADNSCSMMGAGLYMDLRSRLRLRHNSIVHNTGGDGSGVCLAEGTVVMTNTILVGHTTGITVAAGSTARLEATLWGSDAWANGADWGGSGNIFTGTVNLWGDPGFVNPTAGDYHIGPTSAALNAGVNAGVKTDMDGDPRPYGSGYDIGADEYANEYLRLYLPLVLR